LIIVVRRSDAAMSREGDEEKARNFLQAQQHYYRELRSHKADLQRFQASREDHRAALALLVDLPQKVGSSPGRRATTAVAATPQSAVKHAPGSLVSTRQWSLRVR